MKALAPLALLLALAAPAAQATVVDFDDLPNSGTLADGYGGITWGGNWAHYDSFQPPYNPSSPFTRIYADYNVLPGGTAFQGVSFSFVIDAVFNGAFFAGHGSGSGFASIFFELFSNNVSVAVSGSLDANATPTFLASGYGGLIDEVVVWGSAGFYVMDDVTYNTAAIPVPAALPLMLLALGGLGVAARRRRG